MNKRQRKKLEAKKKLKLPNVPHFTLVERWNLFHTFSVYIAAGLKDFLSYKLFGVPQEFSAEQEDIGERNSEIEESKELYEELGKEVEKIIEEREQLPRFDGEQSTEMELWRGTIEKMLWSFEQIRDDYPDSPFNKWHDKQFWSLLDKGILPMEIEEEPDENGLHAVKFNGEETPQEIWDADKLYHQKIQEGIDLFAKYFRNLWD